MVIEVGKLAGSSIIPYSQTTQRTKEVDLTFSSTPAGWNLKAAKAVAYADSDGNWWIQMSVNASAFTFTSGSVSVDGIVFRNISNYFQTLIAEDSVGTSNCYVAPNSNTVSIQHSPTSAAFVFSGAVALESKPAWADANMEASTQADIYVEPASATKSGLVNTSAQEFAGLKDFTEGVDVASVAGSFYETGTFSPVIRGSSGGTPGTGSASGTYTRIGNLVMFEAKLWAWTRGTSTGQFIVEGLPYDILDDYVGTTSAVRLNGITFNPATHILTPEITNDEIGLTLIDTRTTTTSLVSLLITDCATSNLQINISGSYLADI